MIRYLVYSALTLGLFLPLTRVVAEQDFEDFALSTSDEDSSVSIALVDQDGAKYVTLTHPDIKHNSSFNLCDLIDGQSADILHNSPYSETLKSEILKVAQHVAAGLLQDGFSIDEICPSSDRAMMDGSGLKEEQRTSSPRELAPVPAACGGKGTPDACGAKVCDGGKECKSLGYQARACRCAALVCPPYYTNNNRDGGVVECEGNSCNAGKVCRRCVTEVDGGNLRPEFHCAKAEVKGQCTCE